MNIKRLSVLLLGSIVVIGSLALSACQSNPDEDIVVNKNEGVFESSVNAQKNASDATDEAAVGIPASYKDNFTTDKDGINITVDAKVESVNSAMPVVKVKPTDITADQVKLWSEILFDGQTAYEPTSVLTKSEIEARILSFRQIISNRDALVAEYGSEVDADAMIEYYNELIASLENDYENAPASIDRKVCDWTFHPSDYYMESASMWEGSAELESLKKTYELKAVTDEGGLHNRVLDATNRSESDFSIHMLGFYYTNFERTEDFTYKNISNEEAQNLAEKLIEDLNLNNWALWSIQDNSKEDTSHYQLIYTPIYEDVQTILGPMIDLKSEDMYAANFYYEQVEVNILNGMIYGVNLQSPMEIVSVENSDVNTISFDKAYELFKSQARNQFTKAAFFGGDDSSFANYNIELKVDSIRQGLFRIKNKNNNDEFLMVPAWSFDGTFIVNGENWGQQNFVTINAVDGSIINTNLGY